MKNLEAKIEELEAIKPEKSFVVNTKARILKKKEPVFVFYPFLKRALLAVPLIFALAFGVRVYNRNIRYPRVASVELGDLEAASKDLKKVETGLAEVRQGMEKVEKPKDLLALTEEVISTLKEAEKVVETSKRVAKEEQPTRDSDRFETMTVLESTTRKVEKATKDLEETYISKQKEVARIQIREMEEKSLTEKQADLLQQAKDLYNEGRFAQALEKVLTAQNY